MLLTSSRAVVHRCVTLSQTQFLQNQYLSQHVRNLCSVKFSQNAPTKSHSQPLSQRCLLTLLPGLPTSSFVRFNSSTSVDPTNAAPSHSVTNTPSLSDGYIPEPPPIPVPAADTTESVLNAIGEPTLSSLGLCNYTPPGFVQWSLEQLHVGLDIPWWTAIVIGTVIIRFAISPLMVFSRRNIANLHNHQPVMKKLQDRFTKARNSGDHLQAARLGQELMDYMKRNNVNPMKNMLVPLTQMPIFVSMFVGLRAMSNLPVDSMQTGGLLWLQDLTVPDPYFIVPLLTMATLILTFEVGADGVKSATMSHAIKWGMRAMPIIMFPFIMNFPAAVLTYWFSSNLFSLAQVVVLSRPAVRAYFNIPELVVHSQADPRVRTKGFVEGFQESWENAKLQSRVEDRQKADAMRFKQAGMDPIQKTYSFDPTKTKTK